MHNTDMGLSQKEVDKFYVAVLRTVAKGGKFPQRLLDKYGEDTKDAAYQRMLKEGFITRNADGEYGLTQKGKTRAKDGYVIPKVKEERNEEFWRITNGVVAWIALIIGIIQIFV